MLSSDQWFTGVIPALVTPYTSTGEVDESMARQLVRHLISEGVDGFYVGGSTGEGPLQRSTERAQLVELVADEVDGQCPVIAHVGAPDTATCVDLAKRCVQVGADAVSAVAPYYYQVNAEQVRRHYLDIVDASSAPLVVYHYPELSGATASVSFLTELAAREEVIGVKFTSRDLFLLERVVAMSPDDFVVYNGADEVCAAGLLLGARGAIGSTYNIAPRLFLRLFRAAREGDAAEAARLQHAANDLISQMLRYGPIPFVREVLRLQGLDTGEARRPIGGIGPSQANEIREVVESTEWL